LGLEPVEHEVAMKGNQLEAAVKRVANAETGEKDRRARLGDDGVVETQRGIAVAVAAKKRCKRHGSVDTSIGGHRRVFRSGPQLTPYRAGVQFAIRRWAREP